MSIRALTGSTVVGRSIVASVVALVTGLSLIGPDVHFALHHTGYGELNAFQKQSIDQKQSVVADAHAEGDSPAERASFLDAAPAAEKESLGHFCLVHTVAREWISGGADCLADATLLKADNPIAMPTPFLYARIGHRNAMPRAPPVLA